MQCISFNWFLKYGIVGVDFYEITMNTITMEEINYDPAYSNNKCDVSYLPFYIVVSVVNIQVKEEPKNEHYSHGRKGAIN